MSKEFLTGNQAFAYAALEAGVRVCAGYPGTPSSEVIETIAKAHASGRAEGVHVEWSTNEKAALELLAGAAYAGARVLFTCKQVGLNVASDALMSLCYVGVKGGTVLFVADDPGPISSQTEQDTRRFASFAKVPVFDPATPEQGYAMMKAAFELSERYQTPVIMRPTTRICHASTYFDIPDHTVARPAQGFVKDSRWVIFPKRSYEAHGEINDRLPRIASEVASRSYAPFNPIDESGAEGQAGMLGEMQGGAQGKAQPQTTGTAPDCTQTTTPRYGIVAGGISYAYVREALRQLESSAQQGKLVEASQAQNGSTPSFVRALPAYKVMQVGVPYPFPHERAAQFVRGLDEVIVFEELDHVLEDEMLKLAGRLHASYNVQGKLTGATTARGENSIDSVAHELCAFFGLSLVEEQKQNCAEGVEPPARPPLLCAGCPHRGSFYAVKTALRRPSDGIFCGDIGCYTLGNAKPLNAVDTCLCMGAGITIAQGLSVVEPDKKALAFVGDSTFFASGMTGVANAVYNQHDITIVVLNNATTAMTGSQPHPGTGVTLMGPVTKPISIEEVLQALGVRVITHANPLVLDEAVAAAKEAIDYQGPSAVIYEAPCIKLSHPDKPVELDGARCTGCARCVLKLGCPALSWDGEKARPFIDTSLCNGCGLCSDVCNDAALICQARQSRAASDAGVQAPTGAGAPLGDAAQTHSTTRPEDQGGCHD